MVVRANWSAGAGLIMKIQQVSRRKLPPIRSHAAAVAAVSQLTPIQQVILVGLVNGESGKSLSALLEMDMSVIGTHSTALLCTLKADSTADAVRIALLAGLGERSHRTTLEAWCP